MRTARLGPTCTVVAAFSVLFSIPASGAQQSVTSRLDRVAATKNAVSDILDAPAYLKVRDVQLEQALIELQRTSGVPVAFSPTLLPDDHRVTCLCRLKTVGEAVRVLLRGTVFEAVPMAEQLVVRQRRVSDVRPEAPTMISRAAPTELFEAMGGAGLRGVPLRSGVGNVEGSVVEVVTAAPVAGAQVYLGGTGLGTLTDADGRFRLLDVPRGRHELLVRVIGFGRESETVTVLDGETVRLDLRLHSRAVELEEVVVTGVVGGQRRRTVANVVGTVDVEEQMGWGAPVSLQQLLAGQVAGVGVQIGGGNVGTGGNILIRGVRTLTQGSSTNPANTGPLVYIDGIRVNSDMAGPSSGAGSSRLNDINPEEIERVEIIKGPAAATLYGTEASNGVIQIITRKGQAGRPSLSMTIRQGGNWFNDPDSRLPVNYGLVDDRIVSQDLYAEEMAAGRPMFRTGHVQNYDLSVSGGSDDLRYFLSVGHDDEDGYMLNNELTRTSVRTNLGLAISDAVEVSADIGLINSDTRFAPDGQGGTYGMFAMFLWGTPASRNTPSRGFMVGPPEAQNDIDLAEELNRGTASISATHRPAGWLTHRVVAGFDLTDAKVSNYWPRVPEGGFPAYAGLSQGRKDVAYHRGVQRTLDYNITATYGLAPEVTSATSVGAQFFSKERLETLVSGDQLPNAAVSTVGAAARTRGSEDFLETKSAGFFVQETLGWKNQLFVTGAVRGDAHSAFGAAFDAVYYPKLSASWVISDADFWRSDFVESLRLRAAWGKSGLQPDAFAAVRTYVPTTGPGDQPALLPGNLGNPDLEPEIGSELEVGLDARLFGGRIGLELTLYDQSIDGAILQEIVAPSIGFSGSRFVNAGEVSNKGIEIRMDGQLIASRSLSASMIGTLAYNKNMLVSLGEGRQQIQADTRGRFQHRVGYPLGGYWSKYVTGAEWGSNSELTNITCRGPAERDFAPTPCADAPFHFVGPPGPAWHGSVISRFSLPNVGLSLNALWSYTFESRRFSTTTWQRDRTTRNSERAQQYLTGTLDPLRAAEIQLVDVEHPWMERDDHVRLREVSVTYELPSDIVAGYGASRASVTVSGRNLWTPWVHPTFSQPGLDPETRRQRDVPWGWEQTQAPLPHSIVVAMRVTF